MVDANQKRIERILGKLEQVRQRKLSCFGSDYHRFELNPPLDEEALLRFESKNSVSLPVDFRSFLKLAGNGGAGPFYGVYCLDHCCHCVDWDDDVEPRADILSLPCPLYPRMKQESNWQEEFVNCVSPYQGVLEIGNQGCTYKTGLILTGEFAGRVVNLDAEDCVPYVVLEPDFLAWYERWLDELLAGYNIHWFGFGIGGDEFSLLTSLEKTGLSSLDRTDAISALQRLPSLTSYCQDVIRKLLKDWDADVRTVACEVVNRFGISGVEETIIGLLNDEPQVQKAAIRACGSLLKPEVAKREVMKLLDAADEEVAQQAFEWLRSSQSLNRDMLIRLTESSHAKIRYRAVEIVDWRITNEDCLIRLLEDCNPMVRFSAIQSLRRLKSKRSIEVVIELLGAENDEHVVCSILRMLGELPGPRNANILLDWAARNEIIYRLAAVDGLCKLGDLRVKALAESLLDETEFIHRRDIEPQSSTVSIRSAGDWVRQSLASSPNRKLRQVVCRFTLPDWFRLFRRQ